MGRPLTIKKGGPSPYSPGWHTANISSVLKVLPSRQEVRYMNNLLVHKWE